MKWIITIKKATASAVNVTIVFVGTAPIYFLAGIDWWRMSCIALFFGYNLALSDRCFGQRIARTYQDQPTSIAYAALYTASTATLLFWVFVPLDIALANGLFLQLPCLMIWGNTPHGLIARRKTLTEPEYLFESIAMKGQCPDCHTLTLKRNGAYVSCLRCQAFFYAEDFICRRLDPPKDFLPTAKIIQMEQS